MDTKILMASNTSIFIVFLKELWRRYCFVKSRLVRIYLDSQACRLIRKFWGGAKINFNYSFLGKISEVREETYAIILENSRFVKRLLVVYKTSKEKIKNYFTASKVINSILEFKKELTLKTGGIILITAILTNIIFALMLNKPIKLLGWGMRGIFLFIGVFVLFCNVNWQELKKTSFILKRGLF